jgi:carboxypeptidase C (cathepsin A)
VRTVKFSTIPALLTLVVAALTLPASAAAAKAPAAQSPIVPDAVTSHSIVLHGNRYDYSARAGLIALRDQNDKQTATMFYTAYTLDGANPRTRPVTFFYNGGPGSATIWLRMGSFGPVRVVTGNATMTPPAPYQMVTNQYSLLDASDLVFVDMPASGYGRILPGADAKRIFGSDNDVHAFAQFIERYLKRFNRWNSPKFLFGESYGTPRSAMLVDYLQNQGVGVNGVVLQSSIINYSLASSDTYGGASTDDWQYIFALPTEAATAWYFKAVPGAPSTLKAYVDEVRGFAMGEYRNALEQGASLSPAETDRIVATLHRYTGISETYIRNANLRIDGSRFLAEFRRNQGKTQGAYDGRFWLYTVDRESPNPDLEATDATIDAAYIASQNAYFHDELKYDTPLLYLTGAYAAIAQTGEWNFKHRGGLPLNTSGDLLEALTYNPNLRIFSANGYYDSVTPWLATIYTLGHLGLQPPLQRHISYGFYPSGHMIYLNPAALSQFHDDLERWYRDTLGVR